MPTSSHHQGIVSILRDDPGLVFDILRTVFALELPALTQPSDRSAVFDRFAPCFGDTRPLAADLAVSGLPRDQQANPEFEGAAVVIEVLSRTSTFKRFRMWVYQALLAERLELPTALLLIPLTETVSRWGRKIQQHELPSRDCLLVLDRQNMPRVTTIAEAHARPSWTILSAMIHGAVPDLACVRAAMTVALNYPPGRRATYTSGILSPLPQAQREQIMREFEMEELDVLTEDERRGGTYAVAFDEGKHEGMLEGKLEGLRLLVTGILELRGMAPPLRLRQALESCRQPERLTQWAEQAKRVETPDALLV